MKELMLLSRFWITVCGNTEEEHHENYARMKAAITKYNLTTKPSKEVNFVNFVSEGEVRPDPERLHPLRELPVPQTPKSLKRAIGMFSHY